MRIPFGQPTSSIVDLYNELTEDKTQKPQEMQEGVGPLYQEIPQVKPNEIQQATNSSNVGVYLQATHGCCENRGIMARSSLTQTTVLRGAFNEDMGTKKEFMDNIKLQQEFARD